MQLLDLRPRLWERRESDPGMRGLLLTHWLPEAAFTPCTLSTRVYWAPARLPEHLQYRGSTDLRVLLVSSCPPRSGGRNEGPTSVAGDFSARMPKAGEGTAQLPGSKGSPHGRRLPAQ